MTTRAVPSAGLLSSIFCPVNSYLSWSPETLSFISNKRGFLGVLSLSDTAWKWKLSQSSKLGQLQDLPCLFLINWDHYPWLPDVQCPENHGFLCVLYFSPNRRRNLAPVTPSWLKPKFFCFVKIHDYIGSFYYFIWT